MSESMPGISDRTFNFTIYEEFQVLDDSVFNFKKVHNKDEQKRTRIKRRIREVKRRNFFDKGDLEC